MLSYESHVSSREKPVDALRAIAVMAVILVHYGFEVPGGFVGVDIFLVVSGYVITKFYLEPFKKGLSSLLVFYQNRILRILPASIVCIIATLVTGYFLLGPDDFSRLGKGAMATALMAGNIHEGIQPIGYFAESYSSRPLNHYWSLGVEEQFYLLYPLIFVLLWKMWSTKAPAVLGCIALGLLIWSGYSVLAFPVWSYYCPANRAWEFIVGALLVFPPIGIKTKWGRILAFVLAGVSVLAVAYGMHQEMWTFAVSTALTVMTIAFILLRPQVVSRWQSEAFALVGAVLVFSSFVILGKDSLFPGFLALAPVLGTSMLIVSGSNKSSLSTRLMSVQPLVYVGQMSYSVYLWHWPIWVYVGLYSLEPLGLLEKAGLILLVLALSSVSYHFVEKRFNTKELRNEVNRKKVFYTGFLTISTACVVACVVVVFDGWPGRFVKLATQPVRDSSGLGLVDNLGRDGVWLKQNGLPMIGDRSKVPTFLLAGDSHVCAFVEIFDKLGREYEVSGFVSFRSGSLPVPGIWTHRENDTPEKFMSYNSALEEFVRERNLKQVFLVGRWSEPVVGTTLLVSADPSSRETDRDASARTLERHLFAFVSRLKKLGVEVVIVQQLPEHPFHAYKKLVVRGGRLLGVSREDHLARQGSTIDMIKRSGAETVDLSHLLFDESGHVRLVNPDGYPIWWDYDHIGGREVTRIAGPELATFFQHSSQKGDVALIKRE